MMLRNWLIVLVNCSITASKVIYMYLTPCSINSLRLKNYKRNTFIHIALQRNFKQKKPVLSHFYIFLNCT